MKRQDRLQIPQTIPWTQRKASRKHVLEWLIQQHNIKNVVEVGVRRGGTCFYLLNRFPDLVVTAIDTDISQFYNSTVAKCYSNRLIPMQGLSHQVAQNIADASQDLVFIDADHSFIGVSGDINAYRSKLKPGGLLTGHDIDYPGVYAAVSHLIKDFDVAPNFVWIARPSC